jgi:A/G-specific adenine glycosylase
MSGTPNIDVEPHLRGAFAQRLLTWANTSLRDLPWRRSRDPYRIWISEIMLQQTQVATVIPYFERFVERFPGVAELAAAPLADVLKAWEGLGYYARARNLHRAARQILEEHGGRLPANERELRALPGIGRYTAGAILSLAFGQDAPVLDGNVRRVLCRVFAIEDDPAQAVTQNRLWQLARQLIPSGQAGRFNEAVMDLGATVCTPTAPRCPECPLADLCQANLQSRVATDSPSPLPRRMPRRQTPHYDVTAGVIWHDGRLLIAQRKPDRLLGGLWEFPGGKQEPKESLAGCLQREIREELGVEIAVDEPLLTLRHAYTHFRITLHVFQCRYLAGDPRPLDCADWRWATLDELSNYPMAVTDRRIVEALVKPKA